jgi:hypothetical protein
MVQEERSGRTDGESKRGGESKKEQWDVGDAVAESNYMA